MKVYLLDLHNFASTSTIKESFQQNGFEVVDKKEDAEAFIPLTDVSIAHCLQMTTDRGLPTTSVEKFLQLTDKGESAIFERYKINTPDSITPMSIQDIESFPYELVILKKRHSFIKDNFPFTYKSLTKAELISKLPANFFTHQTVGNPSDRYILQQSLRTTDVLPVIILSCGVDANGTLLPTRYSVANYLNGEVANHGFIWSNIFTPQAQTMLDKLQQLVLAENVRSSLFSAQLLDWNDELLMIDWNHRHTAPGMLLNFTVDPQGYSAFLRRVYTNTAEQYTLSGQWICHRFYADDVHFHRPELLQQYPNIRYITGDSASRPTYYTELEYKGELDEFQTTFYSN